MSPLEKLDWDVDLNEFNTVWDKIFAGLDFHKILFLLHNKISIFTFSASY